ncbi:hypothetical protein TSAR_005353 [Trichomalopsis sarcophagae]|uniref:Uncharacterized protein n=1 Tax=Trichomalopsis sarcophagae TaxID=543379 RepID=A0A232EWB8_9HYME|nr:hypothetical protein TSAR_005353 [Trichomalopsis sarcophagae]
MLNIGKSHERIIRKLLESRSDLNQRNNIGLTSFNYIPSSCNVNLVRLCIDRYNADLKKMFCQSDYNGRNALSFAAQNVDKGVMDLVVEMRHYHECHTELSAMKSAMIRGTAVTYFCVLTQPLNVVARYSRNQEIVKVFETKKLIQSAYPIYASRLRSKFNAATARRKLIEEFTSVMRRIFEKILSYLTEEDVKLIVGSPISEDIRLT